MGNVTNHEAVIESALQEANEKVFKPKAIQVKLLKECAFAIPTLVDWLYGDWQTYDVTLTKERLVSGLEAQLANDGMPFTLVALKGEVPIGMISLKREGPTELADFPGPWPGSFHVIPEERPRRIGWHLATLIFTIARGLGHKQLNFYTSNPRNVTRYTKLGARVLETRPFRGHTITIMSLKL